MRRIAALSGLLGLIVSILPALAQTAPGATAVAPSGVPAGTGAITVALTGNFPLGARGAYSFCVASGGTVSKIAATNVTTTSANVALPATAVQFAPSFFDSGTGLVKFSLANRATVCSTAPNYNVAMLVQYPSISSASFTALQQNNLTPGPASIPNSIEVFGANFLDANSYAKVSIDSSYTSGQLAANVITAGSLTFSRPAINDLGLSNFLIKICNTGGNYTYCSVSGNPTIPLYAPATTTLSATATPANVLPGGTSTLSAAITVPGVTQTPGGSFVPGAASGTVTFKDTTAGTTLGTVKVTPSTLTFTSGNAQNLTITTGGFHSDESPTLLTPLVADFNRDGAPDTLIIQNTEATMQLFLGGSPAGTLQAAQAITIAQSCYSLPSAAVGDFNGDGYPDIAYLCGDSGGGSQIYLALNNGDGTFPGQGYYIADAGSATQLAVGFFNNDTILDLVATGQTNSYYNTPVYGIETFFGTGGSQPTFNAGPVTTTNDVPGTQLVAVDLNNDQSTDIALLHTDSDGIVTIQPYQNDGSGNFTATDSIPVTSATSRLVAQPFTTNTAYPDLAAIEPSVGAVVALNKRTASISFSTPIQTGLPTLTDGLFGDFDGDLITDLAYYDSSDSAIHVISGKGDGAFSNVFSQTYKQSYIALQAAVDLNADGHADLVYYEHNGPNSEFLFNDLASLISVGQAKASLSAAFAGGMHNITATYSGNIDLTTSSGTTSVASSQVTPTITWNPPTTATTTTPIDASYLNATSNVAGTFAYTPVSGSYLASGTQTLTAVFTPTDAVTYTSVTTTRTVTVSKSAVSTFTITATPANQTYHSGVPTVISITLNGTHFSPTGTVQFFDGSTSLGTSPLTPTTAGSSVATFTLSSIATGSHAFGANYLSDNVYNTFTVPLSRYVVYSVAKASPILTWTPNPQTIPYGTDLSTAQLDAVAKDASGATIAGTFVYQPAAGTRLDAGEHSLSVTFNPSDTTDYDSATDNASVIVTRFTPVITWTAPAAISYGTALSSTQLDAVAKDIHGTAVPGTFSYAPPAGTVLPVGTTQDTATFTPTSTLDFNTATATVPIVVNAATSTTVLQITPNPSTYGQPVTLKATVSDAGGAPLSGIVTFSDHTTGLTLGQPTLTAGVATVTYTLPTAGTHNIGVTYPGDTNHAGSTGGPTTLTVTKATPSIIWPAIAPITQGTALSATQLDATATGVGGASLPGTFTYTPPSGTVPLAGLQTLTVSFAPTDAADYATAGGSNSVRVLAATTTTVTGAPNPAYSGQTVTFTATISHGGSSALPGGSATFFDGSLQLSNVPVVSGISTFTTSTLGVGPHSIHVIYSGDTNYATSTSANVTQTIVANLASVTWNPTVPTIPYGTPLGAGQLDATGFDPLGNPISGTFTYTPAAGEVLHAGVQTLSVVFTPASQFAAVTKTITITVTKLAPTITWPTPAAITQGTALSATQLNATVTGLNNASLPGTFAYTPAAGTVLQPGVQPLSLFFTPTDLVDYTTGTATNSVVVNKAATSTVMTSNLNPASFGQSVRLTATVTRVPSSTIVPTGSVTFAEGTNMLGTVDLSAGSASITLSSLSAGPHIITASYSGDASDLAGQGQITQVINTSGSTITWSPAVTTISYGTALGSSELNAVAKTTAGVTTPGTFVYTPAAGTILDAGSQLLNVTFTPTDTTNFQTATAQTVITVTRGTPSISWPAPVAIPQGTPLSATQLNASATYFSASVPGTYTYTPAAGTILNAGVQTLNLLFTPTNLTDFNPVTATNSISVTQYATITTVTSSVNPSSVGQSITITATVARTGSSTSPPTGNVTFTDGSTPLGTIPITAGVASLPISTFTVGSHTITATYVGDTNDVTSHGQIIQVVNTIAPTITWVPNVSTIFFGTALGPDQLDAVAKTSAGVTIPGTFTYTPPAGTVLAVGPHTLSTLFTPADTATYQTATKTAAVTVTQSSTIVTWATPAAITYGTPLSATQLDAVAKDASGNTIPGTYVYTPAAGIILSAGSNPLSVAFTPTNTSSYSPATGSTTLTVNKADTATPLSVTPLHIAFGQTSTLRTTVTTASGAVVPGPVTFFDGTRNDGQVVPNGGFASVSLPFTAGTHALTASFAGNANYNPSTSPVVTLLVDQASSVVTWTPTVSTITYGTALSSAQLNAVARDASGATIPGVFTYSPVAGTILDAGTQTLSVTFTPSDTTDLLTATAHTVITVNKAAPAITWPAIAAVSQGTALSATQLNATAKGVDGATLPGVFTYTPATGTILQTGLQPLSLSFAPTNALDYSVATAANTVQVNTSATRTILTSTQNPSTFGQAILFTASVSQLGNATTAITGTVIFTDATSGTQLGTVPVASGQASLPSATLPVGNHIIQAVYSGDANDLGSSATPITQVVNTAAPAISWTPAISTIPYGTALGSAQLNAVAKSASGVPILGAFVYTPAAGAILDAGSQVLRVTFTPTDTTSFQTITGQTIITVTKAAPAITWPAVAPVTQGTALGATQLNAAAKGVDGATLAGVFTYTPPAGTILQAGTQALSLSFAPTNALDYTVATATNSVSVGKSTTTTAVASSSNPAASGQSVTFTATVSRTGSSSSAFTGSVAFTDGTNPIGTVQVTNGVATLPIATLTVGPHLITATYSGDANDLSSNGQLSQVINAVQTNITWSPVPATIVYGTALTTGQFDAVAKNASGATVPGTFTYTPAVGSVPPAGAQTLTASFAPTDPVHDAAAQATATITVTRATPTITWPTPASIDQGTALSATQLNATAKGVTGATLPGSFTYTPPAGTVLLAGTHTLSVTFLPTDTVDYGSATATVSINVLNAMTQTVLTSSVNPSQFGQPTILTASITRLGTATNLLTGTVTFYDGTTQLGDPVQVALPTVPNGPNFATLPIATLAAGTHKLTAIYSGDTNYTTSTSAQFTQTITVAPTTLTWVPTVATIPYGAALSTAQLDAAASSPYVPSVSGLVTYNPAAGTVLNAGTQTLQATFTPADAAEFTASAGSATITVTQATPKITWAAPASIAQGTALSATQLNAAVTGVGGATLPGSFTYTPAAGTILQPGTSTLNLLFTPTDTVNYTTISATVPLTVNIPTTKLVLAATPNPAQTGQPVTLTATISETGTSTQPITGSITFYDAGKMIGSSAIASNAAVLPIATLTVGTHSFSAVYGGSTSYSTSTSNTLPEIVTAATTTIHWTPAPATIVYGTALSTAQLDATASSASTTSVPGAFTYTPATGSVLTAGTQTLTVTFTPTDTVNFAPSTGTTTITVTRATPTLTWTPPAAITQGTALSATQLNATVKGVTNTTLPGTFTYTPASGVTLPSGTATLSVLFTPTDAVDYTTSTTTVTLTVSIPAATTTLASSINPSQYGQSTNLVATVVQGGTQTAIPTGSVNFFDGAKLLGASPLTAGIATLPITTLTAGPHTLTASYAGDTSNATSTSAPLTQTVSKAPAVVTFAPNPSSIVYGTALSAAQLDATATSLYIPTVPGGFAYTPATGAILNAGTTTLSTTFTPTDTANFTATTQTASLTVTRATPAVTFPTPPYTVVGSALSLIQLNASATGVTGATLPGTFTYSPAAGTTVAAGPQVLTVTFTPTDTTNYTIAKATTTLNATALTLTALDSTKATLGDKARTITLTGTGFVSDSVARSNGTALATTYVSATTLQAVIPATSFTTVQTLQISVFDPTQNQTTASIPFTVAAPAVNATVSAPPTASPGDQPSITLNLATPYAFPVTAKFSLSFTPASGGIVDPNIQFAGGGQTTSFDVAAGQTTAPPVQIQSGTVAGVIRITLSLTAGGMDVTPAGTTATVITVPAVVPGLSQVAVAGSGRQFTVTTFGFSNTREITQAHFHFTPAPGKQIQTQDITLDVSSIFSGWFTSPASDAYGSEFLYTQTFTLDDDASVVGQVTVTLTNSVGVSAVGTSQ